MAIPPFVNTRLDSGDEFSRAKQEELFEGITRNFEDLYNRFATTEQVQEKVAKREIPGAVNANGTVSTGTGFASEKTALGTYKITLTSELTTTGVLVVTQIGTGVVPAVPITGAPAKKVFTLETYKSAVVAPEKLDISFSFHIRQI